MSEVSAAEMGGAGDQATTKTSVFRDRLGWYLGVSAYWFATSFKWFIVLQLMPLLVGNVVPDAQKNLWWGRISGVGAIEAMIGPAIFGYLSDRCGSSWGRRRPFIAIGAALTALALLFLGGADRLWMLFAGYLFLQISDDVATGPYAAIVPDLVPEERRGLASGVLSQLQLLAQIAAAVVGLVLSKNVMGIFVAIAVVNVLCAAIVLFTVREKRYLFSPSPGGAVEKQSGIAAKLVRGLREWAAPWRSLDFRWVWFTRFLNALGFYVILSYLPNYLKDVVRVFRLPGLTLTEPFQATIVMSLTLSLSGAVSAVYGGRLADRWGRKRVIYVAGWLMFVTLVPFALVPNYGMILLLAPFFGLGYGAYLSATWAIAADVLPSKEDVAKDMGIWQMSVAAPQVVAGFLVSLVIFYGNRQQPGLGYSFAFLCAAVAFLAGSLLIKRVKGST